MNTLESLFIPAEVSEKLIELGFDKTSCIAGINTAGNIRIKSASTNSGHIISWDKYDTDTPLILWDQASLFLREKHQIHIEIIPFGERKDKYYVFVDKDYFYSENDHNNPRQFDGYYKAMKAALIKATNLASLLLLKKEKDKLVNELITKFNSMK